MLNYSRELHQALISGKKKAIAWGASADAVLKLKQAPYSFECIVDKKATLNENMGAIFKVPIVPPDSLLKKDASEYVIVIFADMLRYGHSVLEDISNLGKFSVVPAFCPWKQFGQAFMTRKFSQFLAPFYSMSESLNSGRQPLRKVTLFINCLSRGGAEKQIVLLAVSLANQGYKVCLITVRQDAEGVDDWRQLLHENGVSRGAIPDVSGNIENLNKDLYEPLLNLFSAYSTYLIIQLSKILIKDRPDVLISYMPGNCLISAISGLLANIDRISLSFRNIAPILPSQDLYCYSTLAVAKDAIPVVLKQISALPHVSITHNSAIGRASYASWMQVPEQKMDVVYNGLQVPASSDVDIKQHHGVKDEDTVLVGVMRLVEQKRPLLFLQCVKYLHHKIPNLKVFLLGDGPLKQEIMGSIVSLELQDVVNLIGNYPTPTNYMRVADVLLHTAEFEGFPNVLLEAQAVGCPIVATNAGGSREVFCDELVEICITENESYAAISTMVIDMLRPEISARYKLYSKEVLNRFSLKTLADNTIKSCLNIS